MSRVFPFVAHIGAIPAGGKRELTYSLRFSPNGPITFAAARDVLDSFAKRYPFTLKWDDRRPIGMMFLATSGVQGEQQKVNPRRWIVVNNGKFDMTTPEGRIQFQQGMLKWADNAVKVHLEARAQGMVTWDIEGQQILRNVLRGAACYWQISSGNGRGKSKSRSSKTANRR